MQINEYSSVKDFAFFPDRALDSYRRVTNNAASTYAMMTEINKEFLVVVADSEPKKIILKKGDTVVSDISLADRVYIMTNKTSATDKTQVVLVFVPNRMSGHQPWELLKAITENEFTNAYYVELGEKPRDMLRNYAYWPNYNEDLKELSTSLALHENWSFKEEPDDDDFPILKSHLSYTFAKLWKDKQVFFSINGRYSVFNTGLVNRNYQYIYILFEQNIGQRPWKFLMFSMPGVKYGGRILAENFPTLPKPAHYFNDISDISYIIASDKTPDEQLPDLQPDHYFIDHPERLPLHFLRDGCRKSSNLTELLNKDMNGLSHEEISEYWKRIGEEIGNDPDVYDDLESSFRNAVRKAVMRVSWNYRTAIPVYFPAFNKMSILLPLAFNFDADAEVALVVERNSVSQKYTAPTILRLPTAYANARLVCKPESDWLNQRVFEPVAKDLTEESALEETE